MIKKLLVLSFLLVNLNFAQSPKILVAYFSHTGRTKALAQQIQSRTGGDIHQIIPSKPYPENYRQSTNLAKKEQIENARPAISGSVANMASYDVIFLGYPCWWGTMPMALFTFLESYNFSGKTIIPFTTHGGSGWARGPADIAKLAPNAILKEGFALHSGSTASPQTLQSWLDTALKSTNK